MKEPHRLPRIISVIVWVSVLGLWLAACAPANVGPMNESAGPSETFAENAPSAGPNEDAAGSSPAGDAAASSSGDVASSAGVVSSSGETVSKNQPGQASGPGEPPSFERPAVDDETQSAEGAQTPGETPGESGPSDPTDEMPSEQADIMTPPDTSAWPIYTDTTYGFSMSHPPAFTVKSTAGDVLFGTTTVATVNFVDTQNELADIAPPPFAVRIFAAQPGQALDAWLEANGVIGDEANAEAQAFRSEQIEGVRVNSRNFMAPGWSVFVQHGSYIFQLVPLGAEGEAMLQSFAFL